MIPVYALSSSSRVKLVRCLSSERDGILKKAWMGFKHLTGRIPPTIRQEEELHELRLALLSVQYRRLLEDDPRPTYDDKLETLWKENMKLKNVGMRYEVGVELAPDILELFETFDKVDRQLAAVDQMDILTQDYEETLREERQRPDKSEFLSTKRASIELLLRHFDHSVSVPRTPLPWEDGDDEKEWHDQLDCFGYNGKGAANDVYAAIRDHQTKNMVRSFLIKQDLGYSIVALKSSIPKAGRGIFVDGIAPPGSILGFFPGQVWPKEYLLNVPPDLAAYFAWERNPNFQLHFRADEFLFDCRASPYTVLENPWAVGHIANHAPITESNSRSTGISFFEKMRVGARMWRYVPNEYAKPPTLMGGSFLDRDVIEMHSMCLLSKKQSVEYEEVLFDYRLPWLPDETPDWYRHVPYRMGGMDEQE